MARSRRTSPLEDVVSSLSRLPWWGSLLIAALISIVRRTQRKKLLVDARSATQPGRTMDGLSWMQFQQLKWV